MQYIAGEHERCGHTSHIVTRDKHISRVLHRCTAGYGAVVHPIDVLPAMLQWCTLLMRPVACGMDGVDAGDGGDGMQYRAGSAYCPAWCSVSCMRGNRVDERLSAAAAHALHLLELQRCIRIHDGPKRHFLDCLMHMRNIGVRQKRNTYWFTRPAVCNALCMACNNWLEPISLGCPRVEVLVCWMLETTWRACILPVDIWCTF
jgi:hypothetical protein